MFLFFFEVVATKDYIQSFELCFILESQRCFADKKERLYQIYHGGKVNVLAKATTSITQAVQLNVTLVLVAVGLACKSVHFSSLLRLAHPLIYIAS